VAEIYPTVSDQEQEAQRAQNRAGLPDHVTGETPVGVYERPARSARSMAGLLLLLLVLAILVYFLFQWLS